MHARYTVEELVNALVLLCNGTRVLLFGRTFFFRSALDRVLINISEMVFFGVRNLNLPLSSCKIDGRKTIKPLCAKSTLFAVFKQGRLSIPRHLRHGAIKHTWYTAVVRSM